MRTLKDQLNPLTKKPKTPPRPQVSPEAQLEAINKILGKKQEIPHYIFNFGKYSGDSLEDVAHKDISYLQWILSEDWIEDRPRLKNAIEVTLKHLGKPVLQ